MKKFSLLLCSFWIFLSAIVAQTNQKVTYPNPPNVFRSSGLFVRATNDGGYILTGNVIGGNTNNTTELTRLIKVDASLQTQWDRIYFDNPATGGGLTQTVSAALPLSDGGYALAARNDSTLNEFLRLNANGDVLWSKDLIPGSRSVELVGIAPNGNYLVVAQAYNGSVTLFQLDDTGNIAFQAANVMAGTAGNFIRSFLLANGDVLIRNSAGAMRRMNANGVALWTVAPAAGIQNSVAPLPDGGFWALGNYTVNGTIAYRFDQAGNVIEQTLPGTILPSLVPHNITIASNGALLVSGLTQTDRAFVAQLNTAHTAIEWSAQTPEDAAGYLLDLNAIPTTDGWAIGISTTNNGQLGVLRVSENSGTLVNVIKGRLAKDDNENCQVDAGEPNLPQTQIKATNGTDTYFAFSDNDGSYQIYVTPGNFTLSILPNQLFFYLCSTANVNVVSPAGGNQVVTLDLPIQSDDPIHLISGKVRVDQNGDCQGDADVLGSKVRLFDLNGNLAQTLTSTTGNYQFYVPDGTYKVTNEPLNMNYAICLPDTQTVTFSNSIPQVANINFTQKPAFSCAIMRADINDPRVRPCSTSVLTVFYRNIGTTIAEDATLKVTLDPNLSYVSASLSPASINGQEITFNLGDVAPVLNNWSWAYISITVQASCSVQIGQELCIEAAIQPDEICVSNPNWSGAIVAVEGECVNNNEATFKIKNVGSAANSTTLNYIIVEDQIVLRMDNFQLVPGDSIVETVPGNGLPLTIFAMQEPGFPGDTTVTFNILNCGGNNSFNSSGFGGSPSFFVKQQCFEVRNSYDPNDKTAYPGGNGPDHMVYPGTPLDYRIRFQNTGNDTAFLVVLRDTISKHLDFKEIEPGASSHPYELAQVNDSIIQFTFRNIQLPDSLTNPAGSQGFVNFRIKPKANLPNGTEVHNKAAIYFDNNPPIITNTVTRVYGKYVTINTDDKPNANRLPVRIYPNPFVDYAIFELPADAPQGTYTLTLMDVLGRKLRTLSFNGQACQLDRENLPAAAFFWRIDHENTIVASGSIVAE